MTLEEAREFFKLDRFATQALGAEIEEVGDGYSKISMTAQDIHRAAHGGVMGGALFTLADFAFAVASNWQGRTVVSQTAQITYLGRAKGKQLIAEAKCVKDGRSICYYVIEVSDELGSQVAQVTSSGFHVD